MSRVSFSNNTKNRNNTRRYPGTESKTVRGVNNVNARIRNNKQESIRRGFSNIVKKLIEYDEMETILTQLTEKEKNVLERTLNKSVLANMNVYENRKRNVIVKLSNLQSDIDVLLQKLKPLLAS